MAGKSPHHHSSTRPGVLGVAVEGSIYHIELTGMQLWVTKKGRCDVFVMMMIP